MRASNGVFLIGSIAKMRYSVVKDYFGRIHVALRNSVIGVERYVEGYTSIARSVLCCEGALGRMAIFFVPEGYRIASLSMKTPELSCNAVLFFLPFFLGRGGGRMFLVIVGGYFPHPLCSRPIVPYAKEAKLRNITATTVV